MSTAQAKAHKARILVVAADLQVQKLLKSIFAAGGYEASFAAAGEGAIRAQAGFRPELVVLDLDLSELRGRDTIIGVRRQSDVPVIALSNRHKEGDVVTLSTWAPTTLSKCLSAPASCLRASAQRFAARSPPKVKRRCFDADLCSLTSSIIASCETARQ